MEEERRERDLRAQVVVEEGEEDEEEEEEEEEENESDSEQGGGRGRIDPPLSNSQPPRELLYFLVPLLQLALSVGEEVLRIRELLSERADRANTTHRLLPPLGHLRRR